MGRPIYWRKGREAYESRRSFIGHFCCLLRGNFPRGCARPVFFSIPTSRQSGPARFLREFGAGEIRESEEGLDRGRPQFLEKPRISRRRPLKIAQDFPEAATRQPGRSIASARERSGVVSPATVAVARADRRDGCPDPQTERRSGGKGSQRRRPAGSWLRPADEHAGPYRSAGKKKERVAGQG